MGTCKVTVHSMPVTHCEQPIVLDVAEVLHHKTNILILFVRFTRNDALESSFGIVADEVGEPHIQNWLGCFHRHGGLGLWFHLPYLLPVYQVGSLIRVLVLDGDLGFGKRAFGGGRPLLFRLVVGPGLDDLVLQVLYWWRGFELLGRVEGGVGSPMTFLM